MVMRSLCLLFGFSLVSHAQLGGLSFEAGEDSSTSALVSEMRAVAPGQKFSVALALNHPEGWHSYYKNPGGIEIPPSIQWTLSEGVTAGEMQWPAPHVADPAFQMDEKNPEKNYTYSGDQGFFITEISVPADAKVGSTISLKAKAAWQICKDSCKDEKASLSLEIPVAAASEADPAQAAAFAKGRAQQAQPSTFTYAVHKSSAGLQLRISGATQLDKAHFVSDQNMIAPLASMQAEKDGSDFFISLKNRKELFNGQKTDAATTLSGILYYTDAAGEHAVVVPATAITKAPAPPLAFSKFLPVLLGMFFGGLILNLMPCVFPVIGIKILGFVQQSGQDKKKIVLHGLLFTLGVLISFWILSGILFAARQAAGGEEFGWGYQLQNKWVVLSLMMMMFVMALNLFGVFEIGTSATSVGGNLQSKQGLSGSFFSGFLATVVATPCSGPFLGAAIGAAIVLPPVQFFTAFTVMALGLSVPYLLMSIFPKLVDYLPRPGAWMETFKQGMSFLLFATAGYLLWIYASIIDLDNALNPILGLSLVALACWIYGRWTTFARPKKTRMMASIVAVLVGVFGFYYSGNIKPGVPWEHWTEGRVEELLEEDKPVFVDFTAKWCALCQVNKRNAYSEEVIKLMEERGVVALKADKTKADPKIEAALADLGRTAIPVNVLYVPGKDLIVTKEVLTPDYLLQLFRDNTEVPTKEEEK